jgi:putative DNA primase/helicase
MCISINSYRTFNNIDGFIYGRDGKALARSLEHQAKVEAARNTPIEALAQSRGLKLRRAGRELVGPCPQCGGHDRFAININKQVWHCRVCDTGGDVISLVRHLDGSGFPAAVAALTGAGSVVERRPVPSKAANTGAVDDDKVRQSLALAIWDASVDLGGTLGLSYLTGPKTAGGRALDIPEGISGRVLRFHPRCPWRGGSVPALVALYRDIRTDEPKAIWRCGLTLDGRKIDRMALGPKTGCAIKLAAHEDVEQGLHIGEGIETMLRAMMFGFAPAWSLGDTGGVKNFPLLPGIEVLTLCVDNDANGAGQKASAECYDRWVAAGREVWCIIPDKVGADMNDIVAGAQ